MRRTARHVAPPARFSSLSRVLLAAVSLLAAFAFSSGIAQGAGLLFNDSFKSVPFGANEPGEALGAGVFWGVSNSGATVESGERTDCSGGPSFGATIWERFHPDANGAVKVDVSDFTFGSNFGGPEVWIVPYSNTTSSARLPNANTHLDYEASDAVCGFASVEGYVFAGHDYLIQVGGDCQSPNPCDPVTDPGFSINFLYFRDTDGDRVTDYNDTYPDRAYDHCLNNPGTVNGCPDSDGDRFIDPSAVKDPRSGLQFDQCPTIAGDVGGCPDVDRDGFLDYLDECPGEDGQINGCPDRDGDRVPDRADECPSNPGTLKGCPDTDGDGFIDTVGQLKLGSSLRRDRCPRTAGTRDGCEVELAQANLKYRDTKTGLRVLQLLINKALPGSTARVSCRRGGKKACKTRVARDRPSSFGLRKMMGKRLQAGTVVDILITKPDAFGARIRYLIKRGGFRKSESCLNVGSLTQPCS